MGVSPHRRGRPPLTTPIERLDMLHVPPAVRAGALLAVAAAALTACGTASGAGTTADSGKPVYGGTLVYLEDRQESCIDPQIGGDIPQAMIGQQYTDDIVYEGAGGKIEPWLAKSWTISPNELTYTFTFRDNVKFTDGTPLNAAAVQANFARVVNPKTGSSTDGGYIAPFYKSSKVLSPYVLQVNLTTPDSSFLDVLAQGYFGIESPTAFARGISKNCLYPVGSGPFEVQKDVPNQEVILVRNPDYNSPPPGSTHTGPAYLKEIVWKIVPDESVRWAALAQNQANVIYNPPAQDYASAAAEHITMFDKERPGSPNSILFNTSVAPLNNVLVREAFDYASDEKANLKSAYFGTYPYVGSPLVPGTPDYDPAYANAFAYNPAKASQLLAQAGYTGKNSQGYRTSNGQVLSVTIPYDSDAGQTPPEDLTLYQDIQASEKAAGIEVTLKPVSTTELDSLWEGGKGYQALAGGYWITNTPDVLRTLYSTQALKYYGTNSDRYSNPTLDKILADGLAAKTDAQRQTIYDQAQAFVAQQALLLPLYPAEERLAISSNTHSVSADYAVGLPDFYDTWISG
jgi:peptide/nickel transport system substrate-binding protein